MKVVLGGFFVTLFVIMFGYGLAVVSEGTFEQGYRRANAEHAARKAEHDRVMQYVGVCKWSKIMAEDIRCKTELP